MSSSSRKQGRAGPETTSSVQDQCQGIARHAWDMIRRPAGFARPDVPAGWFGVWARCSRCGTVKFTLLTPIGQAWRTRYFYPEWWTRYRDGSFDRKEIVLAAVKRAARRGEVETG